MSLSLQKMSGILDGDLLLSPEAIFASNMPQCCFCFLQASGECGSDPTGGAGATGLWEGRSYPARQPKRNTGLNPAGPALGKPRGHRGTLGLRGMWLVLPTLGLRHGPGTSSARGSS